MRLAVLDTSLFSSNTGDSIIVHSIESELALHLSLPRLPTHRRLSTAERREARRAELLLVTGTNLLTSRLVARRPWGPSAAEVWSMRGRVVPVGVGWRGYEGAIHPSRAWVYRQLFSRDIPVSVRDSYSEKLLRDCGINAVNTGCPTMWSLPDVLRPTSPSEIVVTLTDYAQDVPRDRELLTLLSARFDRLLLWPQGSGDDQYFENFLDFSKIEVIPPGLHSFEAALRHRGYVGTRLHAGIRAAQLGITPVIIAVDNRAREIARDTQLPIVERDALSGGLYAALERIQQPVSLTMQRAAIADWRNKFRALVHPPEMPG